MCIVSSKKKKTFYVESMKMLSRNCTVCPLLRGGSRHTACCAGWWMRHCYILSVQSMDFTKWLLPFSSCLQDAGINEAPRPSSQYLLPTVVAVGTQIFTSLLFLILWNGVMFRFYSHLTFIHIDALGFLSPSVSDLPIAMMFCSISEDFLPLLLHLFPRSHMANLRWWLLL